MLAPFFIPALLMSQMITSNPDGSLKLTVDGAAHLAELPLRCLDKEYPNNPGHTIEAATDGGVDAAAVASFIDGCFGLASLVHGHWMLVRLLKTFPNLPKAAGIRAKLDRSFAPETLEGEAAYFARYKLANTFSERTVGRGS